MNTTTIHVKLDTETRDEAKAVAQGFGFSLSDLVKILLKQTIKTKTISLSLKEEPTEYFHELMKEADEDVRRGRVVSFRSGKEALAYFKQIRTSK